MGRRVTLRVEEQQDDQQGQEQQMGAGEPESWGWGRRARGLCGHLDSRKRFCSEVITPDLGSEGCLPSPSCCVKPSVRGGLEGQGKWPECVARTRWGNAAVQGRDFKSGIPEGEGSWKVRDLGVKRGTASDGVKEVSRRLRAGAAEAQEGSTPQGVQIQHSSPGHMSPKAARPHQKGPAGTQAQENQGPRSGHTFQTEPHKAQ